MEAQATFSAFLEAYRATGDEDRRMDAYCVFNWYFDLNPPVRSVIRGGCRDVLADRQNENQGAESIFAFLLALLKLRSADLIPEVRSQ